MSDDKPDLSPRTQTALDKAGLAHEDAADMTHEELAKVPGIGPVAVKEILGEKIAEEEHDPSEAVAADTEHHPVADPPHHFVGSQLVPQATRTEDGYGAATHTERINPDPIVWTDPNGIGWTAAGLKAHRVGSYAEKDHPDGVRWPYTLTRPAFTADQVKPSGSMVWLLPHEVAAFHRPVDRAMHKALGVASKPG